MLSSTYVNYQSNQLKNRLMASSKHSACCISHLFHAAASKTPDKIAVIHASGFADIARRDAEFAFPETTSSSRPHLYDGDECFSFSDILSAVENLSCRLRRILDGAHDPGLIIPCSGYLNWRRYFPETSYMKTKHFSLDTLC